MTKGTRTDCPINTEGRSDIEKIFDALMSMDMASEEYQKSDTRIYMVEIDTRLYGTSCAYAGYTERKGKADFLERIINHPEIEVVPISLPSSCGLDHLRLLVSREKTKVGPGQFWRAGGNNLVYQWILENPEYLKDNNAGATLLTVDLETGLPNYIINGPAYVINCNGKVKLTRGQVWGLQEMIRDASEIFDMDQESMKRGKRALETWSAQYREGFWTPSSSVVGIDYYGTRGLGH